ncbi:MAG: tetratricopeptide repeat protein [Methylobacterium radiotolerans]
MTQSASTRGSGNIVVQVAGDGNTVAFQPSEPALWLRSYTGPAFTEIRRGAPDTSGFTASGLHETQLLSPFTRSFDLCGRERAVADLENWLRAPSRIGVQVMIGGGGRGKTRLAVELAATARAEGWLAGFADREELQRFRAQANPATWGWRRPTLVVVDHAASTADAIHAWLRDLTEHPSLEDPDHPPLRLLLLERHGNPGISWWNQAFGEGGEIAEAIGGALLAPNAPLHIGPLADPVARHAVFAQAFHHAGGREAPAASGALDATLYAASLGGEPLFLAMFGLVAARQGVAAAEVLRADGLALRLAEAELKRIGDIWRGRSLPSSPDRRLYAHLAAVATLSGGVDAETMHAVITEEAEALHLAVHDGTEMMRSALHAALPGHGGGVAAIQPDILGEAALLVAWRDQPDVAIAAIRRAQGRDGGSVARTIIRTCQDFSIRGQSEPSRWLDALIDDIADAATGDVDFEALLSLLTALPEETIELREAAAVLFGAAVRVLRSSGPAKSRGAQDLLALLLNDLSNRLLALDRYVEALAAIEEAVTIERASAAERPGAITPRLPLYLSNLSNCLANFGRCREALAAIEEAVTAYRNLASAHPETFLSAMALSLLNLAVRSADAGLQEEALAAIGESVGIRRELAKAQPERFQADLARSLDNFAVHSAALGHYDSALKANRESVATFRLLAAAQPDAFLPALALSLSNLSSRVDAQDGNEEAFEAAEEAMSIYRMLVAKRPDAFRSELAFSLSRHSHYLSRLGRGEDALASIREAIAIFRGLAAVRPDAVQAELADALVDLSARLVGLRRYEASLAAIQEAVSIYRAAAMAQPDAILPRLGVALNNYSNRLADVGQREAALSASKGAVAIFRPLAATSPSVFLHQLAGSLNSVSTGYAELARYEEASEVGAEAVAVYRSVVETQSARFLPQLAGSLNNLAMAYGGSRRHEDLLKIMEEAVDTYRKLAEVDPDAYKPLVALSLNNLSNCLASFGRNTPALQASEEALALYRPLMEKRPEVFGSEYAVALYNFAGEAGKAGRSGEAREAYRMALVSITPIFLEQPDAFLSHVKTMERCYRDQCRHDGVELDTDLFAPLKMKMNLLARMSKQS